jgi:spermidine dehydrogenase
MKKTDRQLGMHRDITRRDFIHDTGLASLGLSLSAGALAETVTGNPESAGKYYPPTRTGMRGSHPGAFEYAHALAREGQHFTDPVDLDEEYDLVVVGGGISGLAAAYYYRARFGESARILILENHDDFGGHAKRNEFHQGGQMRLSLGGTHNLEYWRFSDTVNTLMEELGVDYEDLRANMEFNYGRSARNGPATWFDAETYGENRLVTGINMRAINTDGAAAIDQFPISSEAREQLKALLAMRTNVLEGMNEEQVWAYLAGISYPDFLRLHGGLGEEALQLFNNTEHGGWGVEIRAMSAAECLEDGYPGLNLLGMEVPSTGRRNFPAMYPDGNASVARLLVSKLIPTVAPGTNAGNIALAKFDYSQLDQAESPVRLRLNSTVVNAANTDGGVAVTYVNGGQLSRVWARHSVLACWHAIIPHLCPDMPDAQKQAQKYQVKMPLLLTNVLIRSSQTLDSLGVNRVGCPGRMHASIFMFKGINTGGYEQRMADDGPVPLVFWGSISPPDEAVTVHEQLRASRAKMLALTFEDYEREVRTVLDAMLGPAGFDVNKDILAITVNRWPHGYAYNYFDLWDPDYAEGQAPHEIARRRFGNMTIANADAGADAYTHVAIDQAWRAVGELPA